MFSFGTREICKGQPPELHFVIKVAAVKRSASAAASEKQKRRPSAIRDFPPGCGRDVPALSPQELQSFHLKGLVLGSKQGFPGFKDMAEIAVPSTLGGSGNTDQTRFHSSDKIAVEGSVTTEPLAKVIEGIRLVNQEAEQSSSKVQPIEEEASRREESELEVKSEEDVVHIAKKTRLEGEAILRENSVVGDDKIEPEAKKGESSSAVSDEATAAMQQQEAKAPADLRMKRKKVGTSRGPPSGSRNSQSAPKKNSGKMKILVYQELKNDPDDRIHVKNLLSIFDAIWRHFVIREEKCKKLKQSIANMKRPDLEAGKILANNDMYLNRNTKIVGHIPGILVGDHFYYRYPLMVVGLHGQLQAGIDYIPPSYSDNAWKEHIAVAVIASGGYNDSEEDDGETLIYTGSGGIHPGSKKQVADQKLEGANLALQNSMNHRIPIRVIRGINDNFSPTNTSYVYDGIYRVEDTYTETDQSGFMVYKFRMKRDPGQPKLVIESLKAVKKWKDKLSERNNMILPDLSSKMESLPVALVNDLDDARGPEYFEYINKVRYPFPSLKQPESCHCNGDCSFEASCSCFARNGGNMPYTSSGCLLKWRPVIYECGNNCKCPPTCRLKVSRRGLKFRFEVFRKETGWGVRSWDLIPAGSFICEYIGEVRLYNDEQVEDKENEEIKYSLRAKRSQECSTYWGNVSGFLTERKLEQLEEECTENLLQLSFSINANQTGNFARFINHSTSPNLLLQAVLHDHDDVRFPHMMLFAKGQIPLLTELTINYGTS